MVLLSHGWSWPGHEVAHTQLQAQLVNSLTLQPTESGVVERADPYVRRLHYNVLCSGL